MIIEIAIGVCLGIVGAVLLLLYWRKLLAISFSLLAITIFISVVTIVGALIWFNLKTVAIYFGAVVMVLLIYGVPFLGYHFISNMYPNLNLLLQGKAPWDTISRLPLRILIMVLFAIFVASLGLGVLFSGLSLIEYTDSYF